MNEWERDRGRHGNAGPGIRERRDRKKGKSPINVKVLRMTFRFGNLVEPLLRCVVPRPVAGCRTAQASERHEEPAHDKASQQPGRGFPGPVPPVFFFFICVRRSL